MLQCTAYNMLIFKLTSFTLISPVSVVLHIERPWQKRVYNIVISGNTKQQCWTIKVSTLHCVHVVTPDRLAIKLIELRGHSEKQPCNYVRERIRVVYGTIQWINFPIIAPAMQHLSYLKLTQRWSLFIYFFVFVLYYFCLFFSPFNCLWLCEVYVAA